MISIFIREECYYSKLELIEKFQCKEENEFAKILEILNKFSIMKKVNDKSKQNQDISSLVEEDFESQNNSSEIKYKFEYVGIVVVEGLVIKCYPKYIFNNNEPTDELKQVIKVIRKFNNKPQYLDIGSDENSSNKLPAMLYLIEDYFDYGIYSKIEDTIEINGDGEIDWDMTINECMPIISNNKPYYTEVYTIATKDDESEFLKRLHQCILTLCSNELEESNLTNLLDIEVISLTDDTLSDLGDKDYLINCLENELKIEFNTRKQQVIKLMISIINDKYSVDSNDNFSMIGTNKFNIIWEKVCAEILDNKLSTPLNELGIPGLVVPAKLKATDKLKTIASRPIWQGYDENTKTTFEKNASPLELDIVTININENSREFIISDAKYYNLQLEKDKKLDGQPGVEDVSKQYLYQLSYMNFLNDNKFDKIKNYFLMPTEDNSYESKDIGDVRMDMFENMFGYMFGFMLGVKMNLSLERIQIKLLSACKVYDKYLSNEKFTYIFD